MAEYVTIRRWALRHDADEDELKALVRDRIVPAYKQQTGCNRLELLHIPDTRSYLAVTHWADRAAFDAWAGPDGQDWRDEYRGTLERWLDLMLFQDEWDGSVLVSE
jgi:heme-degrading monooxygenase HmoA